jgi:hypothetical protein
MAWPQCHLYSQNTQCNKDCIWEAGQVIMSLSIGIYELHACGLLCRHYGWVIAADNSAAARGTDMSANVYYTQIFCFSVLVEFIQLNKEC